MGISNSQLKDLITSTLEDLPKQQFEVMWTNNDYEFCRIYQQDRMVIDGGTSIVRKVMLDHSGAAHYRRMYDTDTPAVSNVIKTITVPWTQLSTDYSWDKLEILRNKNSVKGFLSLMKVRRTDGLWSLADLIEERAWLTPTSATDDLYPYGVPYYLNMLNSGVTTAGFSGQTIRYQDATTGTICAGIDASTEAKWRNYADVYVNVNNDLLRKMRTACMVTKFKPPSFINSPGNDAIGKRRMYAGLEVNVALQDLASKNDDASTPKEMAGKILADTGGVVMFNRIPVQYITQLNDASYSPIYCIDFDKFIPYVQDGFWMEESEPMIEKSQHTTATVFLDGSHNNLCTNRKTCGFVLHTVTAA